MTSVNIDELVRQPPFRAPRAQREPVLLDRLNALTRFHLDRCAPYRRLLGVVGGTDHAAAIADVPYLPVGLFKSHRLVSVPDDAIVTTLASSGTTGQEPSRVFLERNTAQRQAAALASIMRTVLGDARLPMLLVESRDVIADRRRFTARSAGVLGIMNFGRAHEFALDAEMRLDRDALVAFLARQDGKPFIIFGFTFMVWRYFFQVIETLGVDLSQAVLIHSGGWKKLESEKVSNAEFRRRFLDATGLRRIYSFYGMVEQVGSVFLEGDDGLLYTPAFADVVIRNPRTFEPAPLGEPGIIQVLSALPESYPGHSILTEDLGVVHGEDDSPHGWMGKRFAVLGRAPAAEIRGCSDTFTDRVSDAA